MTIKQKKAMKNALDNGGNITAAMRAAGYTEATINNPRNLTKSKAWLGLLDKYLPDELLVKTNLEGLEATRTISATVVVKSDDPTIKTKEANGRSMDFIDVPDYATRHKFLETALKVKGKIVNKTDITTDGEMLPTPIYGGQSTK